MTTLTARIATDLRDQIASGELPPDSVLPSERELVERYGVARSTVRSALAQLVNEGLVQPRTGRGHYVRSFQLLEWRPGVFEHSGRRGDTPEAGADAWSVDVQAQGRVPEQAVDVSIVAPPPGIAERLRIPDGDMVVTRKRVRYVDGTPYQTADTYYPHLLLLHEVGLIRLDLCDGNEAPDLSIDSLRKGLPRARAKLTNRGRTLIAH